MECRTTYRQPQEDVYIYRVKGPLKNARRVFLDYLKSMNELRERPSYYNTLTTNCTTSVLFHTRMNPESPPMSWKVLLSGYVPDYLYELGRLDNTRSVRRAGTDFASERTRSCRRRRRCFFATHSEKACLTQVSCHEIIWTARTLTRQLNSVYYRLLLYCVSQRGARRRSA